MTPVSLQLWSVRDQTSIDFARTVRALAAMGFQGVELAGYGNLDCAGAADAIQAAGLKVSGMHLGLDRLQAGWQNVAAEARRLGCTEVIVPYLPKSLFSSREACAGIGRELNAYGARLRDQGIRLHYHNHGHEIEQVDGATAFEHLLDAAAPENLLAQVDVYWVKVGGADPAAFLRRLGARVTLVHLKDEKELGTGPVDFPSVFKALDGIGSVKWQVIEVEKYSHPSMQSVAQSLATLKSWGRV